MPNKMLSPILGRRPLDHQRRVRKILAAMLVVLIGLSSAARLAAETRIVYGGVIAASIGCGVVFASFFFSEQVVAGRSDRSATTSTVVLSTDRPDDDDFLPQSLLTTMREPSHPSISVALPFDLL